MWWPMVVMVSLFNALDGSSLCCTYLMLLVEALVVPEFLWLKGGGSGGGKARLHVRHSKYFYTSN